MNRLIRETSPYLLQHAHNPVDWFPWGEAALEKARTENKPVLVSIGYAACHWCHVMERESFEDATTAAYMNQHFVNIKIDREERPDLDAIYMEAVQLIAGNGGWPLNVFLTPDARPFYGGTYFPPARAYNRSSWMEVLQAINEAWQQRPQEILSQAENLTHHIGSSRLLDQLQEGETVFSTADLQETVAKLLKQADTRWGGFGSAPKFPQTYAIQFLLRQSYFVHQQPPQPAAAHRQQAEWAEKGLQQALLSLDKMILGGLYDQLGGGFARYATDTRWQVPHFEKMLYDNALLISTLSEAYQLTGKPLYKSVIEQTMQFVQSDWVATEGGFYASYDADSEGVEGKFYTWSKAAIEKTIGADAEQFCRYYQVSDEGNWEETNILWCLEPLEEFCRAHQLDLAATEARFAMARQKLLAVRNQRPRPLLDDKILMNWNALMITACCKAFAATGQDTYREMGKTAAAFIEKYLKDATGYYHNYKGKATIPAFLDDLAFYIQALIHLQEATADQQYLVQARTCLESVLNSFSDEADGFFYYTADSQKDVVVRKKEWYDGATPAGNSVMISNLFYLSVVYQNVHWQSRAEQMLSTLKSAVIKYPTSFGFAALGLQQAVFGTDEVTLNGKESEKMLKTLLLPYWPGKVVQTQNREDGQFPLFVNRWPSGSGTDLFLCRNQSCLPPVQTVAALLLQRDKKKAAED